MIHVAHRREQLWPCFWGLTMKESHLKRQFWAQTQLRSVTSVDFWKETTNKKIHLTVR